VLPERAADSPLQDIRLRQSFGLTRTRYICIFIKFVIWLYLDAEVLLLPPLFLPQDSVFVSRRLRRWSFGILGIPLPVLLSNMYLFNPNDFVYLIVT